MDKLADLLGLGAPAAWAASIYALFAWLDANASEQANNALASTMKVGAAIDGPRVAAATVEIFDRIYSSPLLSLKALSRR